MTQRLDPYSASPGPMKALGAVHATLSQSALPAALLDLVNLRASQINGCAYCIDLHSHDLLTKHGFNVGKLVLVPTWREAGALFGDQERAALAWTESLTRIGQTQDVSDADWREAQAAFGESDLADLTAAIALINAYNRVGVGLRLTPTAVIKGGD